MKVHGIIPAMVTPVTGDGSRVDFDALRAFAETLIARGVHGLFALSSTGEAPLLSRADRRAVIRTVVEAANNRVPVLAGVGAISTQQSLEFADDAAAEGASHIVVLPSHFRQVNQSELYDYFAAVADSVDIPTILYNFPAITSDQRILPETAARLAATHNVIGLKDSSGDFISTLDYKDICGKAFQVFCGPEAHLLALLHMGGDGAICGGANVVPELLVAIYESFQAGSHERALRLHEINFPLHRYLGLGTYPSAVKAGASYSILEVGPPILPIQRLSDDEYRRLTAVIDNVKRRFDQLPA